MWLPAPSWLGLEEARGHVALLVANVQVPETEISMKRLSKVIPSLPPSPEHAVWPRAVPRLPVRAHDLLRERRRLMSVRTCAGLGARAVVVEVAVVVGALGAAAAGDDAEGGHAHGCSSGRRRGLCAFPGHLEVKVEVKRTLAALLDALPGGQRPPPSEKGSSRDWRD